MERAKLKNIVILILLLMNAFLLVLVGGPLLQQRHMEKIALENAGLILEQNGIRVSAEALEQIGSLSPQAVTAARDTGKEEQLARALLGEDTQCTNRSGGLYVYTAGAGSALFRASGEFSVTFDGGIPANGESHAQFAAALLEGAGLAAEWVEESGDTVWLCQVVNAVPVYNCRIACRFEGGSLQAVEGTLLTAVTLAPTGEATLEPATALVRFLADIKANGDVCSALTGLRPGYRMAPSFSAGLALDPVWLVSTDGSDYYLDGVTGQLTRIE